MFMLTVCLAKCIISEVYKKLLEILLLYNYTVRRYIRGYLISSSFLLKKFKKMKIMKHIRSFHLLPNDGEDFGDASHIRFHSGLGGI